MIWAKLLQSRIAWAVVSSVITFACFGVYHIIDKSVAVRSAEKELADLAEITSLKSQLAETSRREKIARTANETLRSKANRAEETALQAEKELADYVSTTDQNSSGVVDSGLHGRLRNK